MVRSVRSTVLLATFVPRSVSLRTCRFNLRFSLISSATMWFSCCVSSGPARRLRRVRVVVVLLFAPGGRPRRRRAGVPPCAASSADMCAPWEKESGLLDPSLCGREHLLSRQTLESFSREFVCGIRFTTHITDHAPTAPASFTNFMHGDAKTVTGRHATSNHGRAVRAHDHAVIWPAGGGEIEGACADVRLELSRPAKMRKAERFRIHRAAPNKNGQATSGPAVLVESGVHIDHQALPQIASLQRRI